MVGNNGIASLMLPLIKLLTIQVVLYAGLKIQRGNTLIS